MIECNSPPTISDEAAELNRFRGWTATLGHEGITITSRFGSDDAAETVESMKILAGKAGRFGLPIMIALWDCHLIKSVSVLVSPTFDEAVPDSDFQNLVFCMADELGYMGGAGVTRQ